jgi:hypothetical protein
MWNITGRLGKLLLGIAPDEATALRRGFAISDPAMRQRLEQVGETFILGYHTALEHSSTDRLGGTLDTVDNEWRGFAYEGAAMALVLLDYFTLRRRDRLGHFLVGPGAPHKYMIHVGVGWGLARIPVRGSAALQGLDPVLKWLAIDGLGFHEGYFHWEKYSGGEMNNKRPGGYAARAFDQGLGRSLWFVKGGDVDQVAAQISDFAEERREDLWSGIGLACAYAGALNRDQLELLRAAAGPYLGGVAQGAAFAAKARQRAGNPAAHTEAACQALCRTCADNAAAFTDEALRNLPGDSEVPRYEAWRRRTAEIIAEQERVRI